MPDVIHLGGLPPQSGIIIQGTASSVASAGDVNGDGIGDFVIGRIYDAQTNTYAGTAYVIFGRAGLTSLDPAAMTAGQGFRITGAADSVFGVSVASGDVNHDGFDDIIVGAMGRGTGGPTDDGAVYVIFGKSGSFSTIDAGTLAMPDGFAIRGGHGYRTGWSVTAADLNGDGFSDIVAGSIAYGGNAGRIDAIFGKSTGFANIDLATLLSTDGVTLAGSESKGRFGSSVSAIDDLTGDGFVDLIVGAPGDTGIGTEAVYLVSLAGAALSSIGISSSVESSVGSNVAGGGDLNGDGRADFVIGAASDDSAGLYRGAVYVIFGRDPVAGAPGLLSNDLQTLAAAQGLKITGQNNRDFLGTGAVVGDVNGDGYDDFALGAPGGFGTAGEVYVLYGGPNLSAIDLNNILPTQGFIVKGGTIYDLIGKSIAGVGDVNGDGLDDILISGDVNSYLIFGMSNAHADYSAAAGAVYMDLAQGIVHNTSLTTGTVAPTTPFTSTDRVGPAVDAVGSAFGDRIYGAADDNWLAPGRGADIVYGMGGIDTISYADAAGAIYLDLGGGRFVSETALTSGTVSAATAVVTTDHVFGFVNAEGSAFGDRLYGTSGNNVIAPGAGADIVHGMGGADTLSYANAAGAIFLDLGAGRFVSETALTTGTVSAATAVVTTDSVIDFVNAAGSAFGDRLYGTGGDNVIAPGAGADIVHGMGGTDTVSYADAAGAVFLDLAGHSVNETALIAGTVVAATPVVTIDHVFEFANAEGSSFGDRLYGTSAANVLDGMNGADILYGLDGTDTLRGGDGADLLSGGDGADFLIGGNGDDIMIGGASADGFHWDMPGEGVDRITDFSAGVDSLSFLGSAFGYSAGASATLVSGSHPVAASPNSFLYDTDTGLLSFDADGAGGAAATAIVQLQGAPAITTADFLFV